MLNLEEVPFPGGIEAAVMMDSPTCLVVEGYRCLVVEGWENAA